MCSAEKSMRSISQGSNDQVVGWGSHCTRTSAKWKARDHLIQMSSAPRTHIQITAHTWTKGSEEAPQWPSTPHSKTCSISSFSTRDLKPQGRGIPNNKKNWNSSERRNLLPENAWSGYMDKCKCDPIPCECSQSFFTSLLFNRNVAMWPSGRCVLAATGVEGRCRPQETFRKTRLKIVFNLKSSTRVLILAQKWLPYSKHEKTVCSYNTNPSVFWASSIVYSFPTGR